ncbi:hypothetical protein N2152v2_001945 [Parachlorella kessleri]
MQGAILPWRGRGLERQQQQQQQLHNNLQAATGRFVQQQRKAQQEQQQGQQLHAATVRIHAAPGTGLSLEQAPARQQGGQQMREQQQLVGRAGTQPTTSAVAESVVKVRDPKLDNQHRTLVYSKSKSGRSLQRTGVRAAAAKQAMTWCNPTLGAAAAGLAASPGPAALFSSTRTTAVTPALAKSVTGTMSQPQRGSSAVQAALQRPLLLPPVSARQTIAGGAAQRVLRKSSKWNKYARAAAGQAASSTRGAAVQAVGKWNKFVRKGEARLSPAKQTMAAAASGLAAGVPNAPVDATAVAAIAEPRGASATRAATTGIQHPLLGRPAAKPLSSSSKSQRLLRLGSSMYKVLSKGRSRSLHRQRSSPLPDTKQQAQQQQQQQQQLDSQQQQLAKAGLPVEPKQSPSAHTSAVGRAGTGPLKAAGGVRKLSSFKLLRNSSAGHKLRRSTGSVSFSSRGKAAAASKAGGSDNGSAAGKIVFCPAYCRTGKCSRRGKGCPYKHDSTKRMVCPRWLRGVCSDAKCPLQHQRKRELMPVCMHFLKGLCTAAECPYMHVNLSAGAPVCKAFLRGYCPAGADCPHKHYTLRMVKEERRLEQGGSSGGGAGEGVGKPGKAEGGKKRSGRYFTSQQPGDPKRTCSGSEAGEGPAAVGVTTFDDAGAAASASLAASGEVSAGAERQPRSPEFLLEDIIML